jgi:Uma2 family endonuclease
MAAMKLAPPTRMTYEEFLKADFGGQRVEWVNGEIDYMGTVSRVHNRLVLFLASLMQHFVEAGSLGEVHSETFNMRLSTRPSGRNPDVLVVLTEHGERIKNNFLDGPADLVVEVVSPDDRSRDTIHKVVEYEAGGVAEYWIIDPERKEAVFLVLNEAGHYVTVDPNADSVYHSSVIDGLWIKVDWLFQEPLPPLMDVLREWKLVQ